MMTRTNSHLIRSSVQQALAIQEKAYEFLREQRVPLAADEQSAEQVLHLRVDRPISKWLEVFITMNDPGGKPLWQEKTSYAAWTTITGKGAAPIVSNKIGEILQKHLAQMPKQGVELQTDATQNHPASVLRE
jgi:hypothetical protein